MIKYIKVTGHGLAAAISAFVAIEYEVKQEIKKLRKLDASTLVNARKKNKKIVQAKDKLNDITEAKHLLSKDLTGTNNAYFLRLTGNELGIVKSYLYDYLETNKDNKDVDAFYKSLIDYEMNID